MKTTTMTNFQQRILTAAFGVPLIFLVIYTGGLAFFVFILIIIALGLFEFFRIVNLKEYKSVKVMIVLGCVLIASGAYMCSFMFMAFFTLAVLSFMLILLRKSEPSGLITALGMFIFPVLYFGWLFSHSLLLRNITFDTEIQSAARRTGSLEDPGFFFMIMAIACTFLNDTGAYVTGKWKGSLKLAPSLSPGKTVEGTAGGIVISLVTALVVSLVFYMPVNAIWALTFGFVIAVSAVAGDLFESSIKRGIGVKDSGDILPGHGGIMDRFDSLFFVFPVTYYLVLIYYYFQGADFF